MQKKTKSNEIIKIKIYLHTRLKKWSKCVQKRIVYLNVIRDNADAYNLVVQELIRSRL